MGIFRRRRNESASPADDASAPTDTFPAEASTTQGPRYAGRPLSLPAPPTADGAPTLADCFVDAVARIEGVHLDYSVDSLVHVDALLGTFETPGSDETAETILMAGFYVGEVLVRSHGYTWSEVPEHIAHAFAFGYGVASPQGTILNPLGKAFSRVENGDEDNLHFFVTAQLASDARQ